MKRFVVIVLVFAAVFASVTAQVPVKGLEPSFEVASVRPVAVGPPFASQLIVPPQGAITCTMCVVDQLVAYAYQLRSRFQLAGGGASGGPRWFLDEPYEIRALPPPAVSHDQVPDMMRALLAERFKLKVHWENRDVPVYALVTTQSEKRLGPGIRPSMHDCAASLANGLRPVDPDAPRTPSGEPLCLRMIHPLGKRPTIIGGASLSEFVEWINGAVGHAAGLDRLVVDQTGLAGNFDIEILFDPRAARPLAAIEPGLRSDVPDLRQALEDQLRLRLEERTMPMEVLVIDSAERPTPD